MLVHLETINVFLVVLCRNIPRAVVISVPIVVALYVFVNIAFFAGLSKAEILSSEAVALVRSWLCS